MTSTTDMPTNAEVSAIAKEHRERIAAEGRDKLPAWLNVDALDIDWDDVEYRRDAEAEGRLLVDALARWIKTMLPVSEWPSLPFEGDERDVVLSYLGFDAIEYVVMFIDEIKGKLEQRDDDASYDEWANDPKRRDVWEQTDPPGWVELRVEPLEAVTYVERFVEKLGGTVTWPEQ